MTGNQFHLGIDVGGTFTDAVLICEQTGRIDTAKVPSTPADPSIGFMAAVERALETGGVDPGAISHLVHGTTVATNSLIEGKTPKTAFVTTEGFGDMLEIARQVRPSLYDVHFEKLRPLVPRDLCYEVPERLDAAGGVLRPLEEDAVREISAALREQGVRSVAVCLLHGYANPVHETRVAEILREEDPELLISLSSSVCPEFREYFRASTCVINACIIPVVARYLAGIEEGLGRAGLEAELLVMQSNGGVLTAEQAASKPVFMVESGPAAGVVSANFIAGQLGHEDLISFDMGGTTAKAGLVLDGSPRVTKEYEVGAQAQPGQGMTRAAGYPIRTPVIDLVEVGAGGGSLAWVDAGGGLRVGPRSAGADPGPICYGRGGTEPTITDANLVLGRLNPDYFLGGEMALDVQAAAAGIRERCADPLGLDPIEAANGIIEIANATMINALRLVTVRRGNDPRELTMVAFGGAGPLHANRLCMEMQIPALVIPPSPGTASALGLLVTDLRHEFSRTQVMSAAAADGVPADFTARIRSLFEGMEEEGRRTLRREGVAPEEMDFRRGIEMRYAGQSSEVAVPLPHDGAAGRADAGLDTAGLDAAALADAVGRFHVEHERAYGHGYPEQPVELVNFTVTAIGRIARPRLPRIGSNGGGLSDAQRGMRQVFFSDAGGFVETAIYDRARLSAGHIVPGPAIIEEVDSTTLVHAGYRAAVDDFGNLLISTGGAA
ncbi:hydantoinase/oxoprolinase family protein [Candidatus Palauibacter sp.]|uniref:hydantoinase/oxoprolinase family protein n=1 Tax=Candidatus Palauibacter sp. TaxID=3101350 RepID=UPI003B5162D1